MPALSDKQPAPYLVPGARELIDLAAVAKAGGDNLRGQRYLAPEFQTEAAKADAVVAGLAGAHDTYRKGFEALQKAANAKDPAMTPEAGFLDLKRRADAWIDDASKRATAATAQAKRAIEGIDNDIRARLEISEGPRSEEIRGHFKGLKENERFALAMKAVEAGDKETIASLLIGPAYLTGLSDDQRNVLRNQMAEKFAGDLVTRKKVIEKGIAINDQSLNELLLAYGEIFPKHRVDEVTKAVQAAKAVRDEFFKL
ncbi:hypothetical protein [Mesorhizobium sp.]|uniref:hypothetical protein n=1 Tax=Mesorhizobium sp. TaxID=1871066 RepID=UPI000FE569A6|nr:hypothetical protein [Mesorhizobium sp.]RWM39958.1 MAG: hypothetical protein EOR75_12325 [Mesorhizobium sp.]TJV53191.1 MAG: hypothetical protein E5Y01_08320 [Mesorhizobium sp.]